MQYKHADLIEAFECNFRARVNRLSACNRLIVTSFQAKVLLLVEKNVGCSQQEIADWLSRDKAQVARTVQDLEKLKLIYRNPIKIEGKVLKLRLTKEGELMCNKINFFRCEAIKEMFCSISIEDKNMLETLLYKLVKNLSEQNFYNEQSYSNQHKL